MTVVRTVQRVPLASAGWADAAEVHVVFRVVLVWVGHENAVALAFVDDHCHHLTRLAALF